MGGIAGSLLKSVGKMAMDSFAENGQAVDEVQRSVKRLVEGNEACRSALGNDLTLYPPISSSMSSYSVNGKVIKQVNLQMQIAGSMASGFVSVQATSSPSSNQRSSSMKVENLSVQLPSGRVVNISGEEKIYEID